MRARPALPLALLVAGCASPSPQAPATQAVIPPSPEAACPAEGSQAEREIARLLAEGRLDEAAPSLERATASCPSPPPWADSARKQIDARLASLPSSPGKLLAAGLGLRASGDEAGAMAAFSKMLRQGPAPRALALSASPWAFPGGMSEHGVRLDASRVLVGARAGEERGALVLGHARRGGEVVATPLRLLARRAAPNERFVAAEASGSFAVVTPEATLLAPGPDATSLLLPGGSTGVVADRGSSLVLGKKGAVRAFDARSGEPRSGWVPLAMPEPASLVADPGEPWVSRCSPSIHESEGEAFVLDARTGRLLARGKGESCALDRERKRMVVVRSTPVDKGPSPTWVEVHDLASGKAVASLRAPPTELPETALIDEGSGLVRLPPGPGGRPPARWVDPLTGKAGKYVGRPQEKGRLAGIPRGEADFVNDLSPLAGLTDKPRELVPNDHHPQLISWTSNGVRSPDGKRVAVLDRLPGDPGDKTLIVADAETLSVRHRVKMPELGSQWLQVSFMDDAHVTVRFDWTTLVIDVETGTLRASVDTSDVGGKVPLWLGDDLALVGAQLLDLSSPLSFEQASRSRVSMPFTGDEIEEAEKPEGLVLTDKKAQARWVIRPDGRLEAPSGSLPPWLVCSVGEWLLPFDACAHRLRVAPRPVR